MREIFGLEIKKTLQVWIFFMKEYKKVSLRSGFLEKKFPNTLNKRKIG